MRNLSIVVILAAVSLAGCADGPAPIPQDDEFRSGDDLQATETTGVIRGVVVDDTITPIEGVTVTLTSSGATATSNDVGEFAFDELEPGTYFMEVTKVGYIGVQTSAQVEAGVDRPPVVKVIMERDATFNPYSQVIHHLGYYQCGLAFVVVCGAPNVLLGDGTAPDSSTWTFTFDVAPAHVPTEMVWESTQGVSPDLRLEVETLDGGCSGGSLVGNILAPSPLRIVTNGTIITERGVGPDCGLYHSVFAGDILDQAHCFVWVVPIVKCGVGFAIEQSFEWFVSEFHGYEPPEEWWFIDDGEYPPPR